jgi:hypothetical protein
MVIELEPPLERKVKEEAAKRGWSAEKLVNDIIREKLDVVPSFGPQETSREAWLRLLRSATSDCGVVLSEYDVSRENMYD